MRESSPAPSVPQAPICPISEPLSGRLNRKKLLVLSFFPAFFPANSGGEQRLNGFYRSLSAFHDVTLLSWTFPHHKQERIGHCSGFEEYRFPKTAPFVSLHQHFDQEAKLGGDVSALVCAMAGELENPVSTWLMANKKKYDVVIHESPFTATCDDGIGCDGIPRVYMSYNVEWRMFESYYTGPWKSHYIEYAKRVERTLAQHSARTFAVSAEDRAQMITDFNLEPSRVGLTPSGIHMPGLVSVPRTPKTACFMGSVHPPNVIAARYVLSTLAPACVDWQFVVMGSVCDAIADADIPPNVHLLGRVSEEIKTQQLCQAQLLLNPMSTGSGTNIKMLDYLAHAGAVLTTPFGARGLHLTHNVTGLIAELADWPGIMLAASLADAQRLGRAGRSHVEHHFAWGAIAERCAAELVDVTRSPAPVTRPLMVVVNDFPIDNAQAGGSVRIRSLLTELAYDFNIIFLALAEQVAQPHTKLAFGLHQEAFPWPDEMRAEYESSRGKSWISIVDVVAARHCVWQQNLVARLSELLSTARLAIMEHCYVAPVMKAALQSLSPTSRSGIKVVYESLNVERDLKRSVLASHPDHDALLRTVDEVEQLALDLADQVLCVTQQDLGRYREWMPGKRVDVVENGVRVLPFSAKTEALSPLRVVFIGSGHPPNIEAASFLLQRLAPTCPSIEFAILGSCVAAISHLPIPPNVLLAGEVSEQEKREWFGRSHVGINPMFSGGGSSLKVADYMASGLIVVSSAFGFRGYDVCADEHLLVAGSDRPEAFRLELELIIQAPSLAAEIRDSAARWVATHLSWISLAARYRNVLTRKRLLALTYRFTDPPRGGAETYLFEVVKRLESQHEWLVDITTSDASLVANHHHFGSTFTGEIDATAVTRFVNRIVRFKHQALDENEYLSGAKTLMRAWEQEWPNLIDACADTWKRCDEPLLLDGWHWPERSGEHVMRWAGQQARVWLPAGVSALQITYAAGARASVHFASGDGWPVSVSSDHVIALPGRAGVLQARWEPYPAPDDCRALGALVQRVRYQRDGRWIDLNLETDAANWLARNHLDQWVDALILIAKKRDRSLDELFIGLRGPRCAGIAEWLANNAQNYDAIVVHGVPFSFAAQIGQIKRASPTATVLLPHFHVEDRYYHWNTFYQSMQSADRVVLAPRQTYELLGRALPMSAQWLPGGGTDQHEFVDADAARAAFAAHFEAQRPFFLILGRKVGNKRYQAAIAALRQLNSERRQADIVMIGPDGDGADIATENVHYLGALPRAAVLGALHSCVALVSMSESESFGIVIVEAWMCEKPVLVSAHSAAFRELVADGVNGRLVHDTVELTEAMRSVLANPQQAQRWGEAGKREALAHYTWDALAAGWATLLDEIATPTNSRTTANTVVAHVQ